ncbi:MAG: hypothetical protein ACQESR_02355 [Planctomycetota bacterium]
MHDEATDRSEQGAVRRSECEKARHQERLSSSSLPLKPTHDGRRPADRFNDDAIRQYDSGAPEDAERLWQRALETSPDHPEAAYNLGLCHWRSARCTDLELIERMEKSCHAAESTGSVERLLALVHLERADIIAAKRLLTQVDALSRNLPEVRLAREALNDLGMGMRCFQTLDCPNLNGSVVLSSDNRCFLASSRCNGAVALWDLKSLLFVYLVEPDTGGDSFAAVCPASRRALSATGRSPNFRLWDLETRECLKTFDAEHPGSITALAMAHDGRRAVSGTYKDGIICFWDIATGKCLKKRVAHRSNDGMGVISLRSSADGRFVVSTGWDETLKTWDSGAMDHLRTIRSEAGPMYDAVITPEARTAISADDDNLLRLWDLKTGECLRTFVGAWQPATALVVTSDGRRESGGGVTNLRGVILFRTRR